MLLATVNAWKPLTWMSVAVAASSGGEGKCHNMVISLVSLSL